MRCLLGCFGGQKKHRRQTRTDSDQASEIKLEANDRVAIVEETPKALEICDEVEEKCSQSPTRKRVTFDSQVITYEPIVLEEPLEILQQEEESVESYPLNHRYKNCRESDDDDDEVEEEDELDDEDEEYYSDDGFSEDTLLHKEIEDNTEERMCSESVKDGDENVLNPVENLTLWRSAKSKGRTINKQSQKENSNSNQELTVEASLSTWLSNSETGSEGNSVCMETPTPEKKKGGGYAKRGVISHDDRPVLCALTLEEVKQFSANSTPRKSPCKSPDETPIIGTVGGFWGDQVKAIDCDSASSFKGIPNTTSKYREDNKVNWHSTPFEARLEKALSNRDK